VTSESGEEGYALLAAIATIAVFATIALTVLSGMQTGVMQANAEIERAHADAAADAGVQLALQGLLTENRAFRWSIDGRARQMNFGDARLAIRVEDQRGKVPLAALDEDQAKLLFEKLGLSGERLGIVIDSFLDWVDDDDDPRPNGAELDYYAARGIHPRNSAPLSIDELALVRGFDPALVERLKQVATLHFGTGSFEPRHADPFAIAVMTEGGEDSPEAIDRQRELDGQRTAIELDGDIDLTGRPLGIVVDAYTPGGGHARRREIVELTGVSARPYVIREYE